MRIGYNRWLNPEYERRMKSAVLAPFVLLVGVGGLAGCGQKGGLYLPGHNPNPPRPLVKPAHKHSQKPGDSKATGSSDSKTSQPSAADSSP